MPKKPKTPAQRMRAMYKRKQADGLIRVALWIPKDRVDEARALIAALAKKPA